MNLALLHWHSVAQCLKQLNWPWPLSPLWNQTLCLVLSVNAVISLSLVNFECANSSEMNWLPEMCSLSGDVSCTYTILQNEAQSFSYWATESRNNVGLLPSPAFFLVIRLNVMLNNSKKKVQALQGCGAETEKTCPTSTIFQRIFRFSCMLVFAPHPRVSSLYLPPSNVTAAKAWNIYTYFLLFFSEGRALGIGNYRCKKRERLEELKNGQWLFCAFPKLAAWCKQKNGGVRSCGACTLENTTTVTRQRYFLAHAKLAKTRASCAPRKRGSISKRHSVSLCDSFVQVLQKSPGELAWKTSQQPTSDKNVMSLNKGNSTRYWKEWQKLANATLSSCGGHKCKTYLACSSFKAASPRQSSSQS